METPEYKKETAIEYDDVGATHQARSAAFYQRLKELFIEREYAHGIF